MRYSRFFLLTALMSFFLIAQAFSQTKKGFKYLKKGKYEQALVAFEADLPNPELKLPALFGKASVLGAPQNPKHDYRQALVLLDSCNKDWKSLKGAQRTELTKKWDISGSKMDALKRDMPKNAWSAIEKTGTLQQTDEFFEAFPAPGAFIEKKARKRQSAQLDSVVQKAKGYDELAYVLRRHRDFLASKHTARLQSIEKQVFDMFLAEKGLERLPVFFAENPEHPLSGDFAKDDFPRAWKSDSLGRLVRFLATFPSSGFCPFVREKAVDMLRKAPADPAQTSTFSEHETRVLKQLEWAAAGKKFDAYAPFQEAKAAEWSDFVLYSAPSDDAFNAVKRMYDHYAAKAKWTDAEQVLGKFGPLFPDKKEWFAGRLAIVAAPDSLFAASKPTNIGPAVNTSAIEAFPVPSLDGRYLYFLGFGRGDNVNGEDIFVSERSDTGWTAAKIIREISGAGHQSPLSLLADGNRLIMFENGKPFLTTKTESGWTRPERLEGSFAPFGWVGLVQITPDERTMMFEARFVALDEGRTDLYVSRKDSTGAWGKPIPLEALNTTGNDRTPFLYADGKTLYFSSSGHPGIGNMDVFKTTRLDDTWLRWSTPVNLGKTINTPGDDWCYKLSADGTTAWFAARTEDAQLDIFSIGLPQYAQPEEKVALLTMSMVDTEGKPLAGKIVLRSKHDNKLIGKYQTSGGNESTSAAVPKGIELEVAGEKDGYLLSAAVLVPKFDAKDPKPRSVKVVMVDKKVLAGKGIEMNLFFDHDKHDLEAKSLEEIRVLAGEIKKTGAAIRIEGFTDNTGTPEYNLELSQKRVDTVKAALVQQGLDASKIEAIGQGEAYPVGDNTTEAGRAQNRRVKVFLKN